jgi:hypothetical protein
METFVGLLAIALIMLVTFIICKVEDMCLKKKLKPSSKDRIIHMSVVTRVRRENSNNVLNVNSSCPTGVWYGKCPHCGGPLRTYMGIHDSHCMHCRCFIIWPEA